MKIVKVKAYKFEELIEKSKSNFINKMYEMPFDYEDEENGEIVIKYDYFADMTLSDQIDFCDMNDFLFDKYGNIISNLIIDEKSEHIKDFLIDDSKKL